MKPTIHWQASGEIGGKVNFLHVRIWKKVVPYVLSEGMGDDILRIIYYYNEVVLYRVSYGTSNGIIRNIYFMPMLDLSLQMACTMNC